MRTHEYFRGKTLVLTGAAQGLGRAIALELGKLGTRLYLIDRDEDGLSRLSMDLADAPCLLRTIVADVSDQQAMEFIEEEIREEGPVDIVIANAGVNGTNSAEELDLALHRRVMEINHFGSVNTIAPFIPGFVSARAGHVVGISSIGAFRGMPRSAHYFASKSATAVFLECLRLDLKKHGIAVTTIFPGFIRTGLTKRNDMIQGFSLSPEQAARATLRAIAARKRSARFPWPMRMLTFLTRILPDAAYDLITLGIAALARSRATAPLARPPVRAPRARGAVASTRGLALRPALERTKRLALLPGVE